MRGVNGEDGFSRSAAILGDGAMKRLASAHALVVGVGGVGSWCAEALVRTGLGHITLIDDDTVAASNLNRQCPATARTLGRPKVEAMAERLREINPVCEVVPMNVRWPIEQSNNRTIEQFSLVVDAIDSVDCKAELILGATEAGVPLVSSMGAALRTDPTKVRITRFEKVEGDGLARALRQRFKKLGRFPTAKFTCVWSSERAIEQSEQSNNAKGQHNAGDGDVRHVSRKRGNQNPNGRRGEMKIGFIGAGKMAEGILQAVLSECAAPKDIIMAEKNPERAKEIATRYGVEVTDDLHRVVKAANVFFLAVRPQDVAAVAAEVKPLLTEKKLLVSIVAGKTLARLRAAFGTKVRMIRVMPNLALRVKEGMCAICGARNAKPSDIKTVSWFLDAAGEVVELKEKDFDAVTALSGSGPAFYAYMEKAMIAGTRFHRIRSNVFPLPRLLTQLL